MLLFCFLIKSPCMVLMPMYGELKKKRQERGVPLHSEIIVWKKVVCLKFIWSTLFFCIMISEWRGTPSFICQGEGGPSSFWSHCVKKGGLSQVHLEYPFLSHYDFWIRRNPLLYMRWGGGPFSFWNHSEKMFVSPNYIWSNLLIFNSKQVISLPKR